MIFNRNPVIKNQKLFHASCKFGSAVQVAERDPADKHKYCLNEENLKAILEQEPIKGLPVVVMSIAGTFRKGKSFLLGFFLRYLNNVEENHDEGEWLGNDDDPLQGFPWRGGSEADTVGIYLWSQAFITTLDNGQEVAVLLMDTQGSFDNDSIMPQCSTIFALSTMISSLQIYNIPSDISDLQYLDFFSQYGRMVLELETEHGNQKPVQPQFQSLMLLVRDWSSPYEYSYGLEGGTKLLEKRLEITADQHPQLSRRRQRIRKAFSDLSCCLMPHPGLEVFKQSFTGCLKDIEKDFRLTLLELIPYLLHPSNLEPSVKLVGGSKVTTGELFDYFQSSMDIFNSSQLPEPKTIYDSNCETIHMKAYRGAVKVYTVSMDILLENNKRKMKKEELKEGHKKCCDLALEHFDQTKKMGGKSLQLNYRDRLEMELEMLFSSINSNNEARFNLWDKFKELSLKEYAEDAVIVTTVAGLAAVTAVLGAVGLVTLAAITGTVTGLVAITYGIKKYVKNVKGISLSVNGAKVKKLD